MGDDLMLWRASVGLFHSRCYKLRKIVSMGLSYIFVLHGFPSLLKCLLKNYFSKTIRDIIVSNFQFFIIVNLLLMLKAGDVEQNQGPIQNSLSILHLNVRSIRHKLDYIRDSFLDFDILCFSETHLDNNVLDNSLILNSNYSSPYRKDRTNHGGGLLVYIHNDIIHSREDNLEIYCNESIWVSIKSRGDNYLLGLFYSPKTADQQFFNNFNLNIEKAYEKSNKIVIVGDLNEDLLNPVYRNLKNIFVLNSMKNIISEPTRANALLDPIIIPSDLYFINSDTISVPNEISDHKATFVFLPFSYQIQRTFERKIWLYKRADFLRLNELITNCDWSCLLNNDLHTACSTFTSLINSFIETCIPSKKVLIRKDDKPWFDSTLRSFCRKRDRLKSIAVKSGKISDWNKYKENSK